MNETQILPSLVGIGLLELDRGDEVHSPTLTQFFDWPPGAPW